MSVDQYNSLLAYARSKQANEEEEDKEEKEKPSLLSRAAPYVGATAGAGLGMVGAGMLRDYLRGRGVFEPKAGESMLRSNLSDLSGAIKRIAAKYSV